MGVFLYSFLSYPECKAQLFYAALQCHVRLAWFYPTLPNTYSIIFGKNVLNTKFLYSFPLQLQSEAFHTPRRIQ